MEKIRKGKPGNGWKGMENGVTRSPFRFFTTLITHLLNYLYIKKYIYIQRYVNKIKKNEGSI